MFVLFVIAVAVVFIADRALTFLLDQMYDQEVITVELDLASVEVPFVAPLSMEGGVTLFDEGEEAREQYVLVWIEVSFGLDSVQQWESEEEATGLYEASALPLAISCHREEHECPNWRREREDLVRALEAWIYE